MKKRSFSKILLILMLAAVASLALVGCGEFSFGNYGFENPVIDSDWRDLEYPETDIILDGEGNESIWQNTMPTQVKDETGEVTMTTKVHFGEEGAFFLMENDDPWVYYNDDRVVYHNTSMELYVSTTNTGLTKNTVQLRFGVNGYTEQWIGLATSNEYAWTRVYVKCMSRVKIKGELNTADNEGYAIEAYMPYSEIGLTEKPDKLYVLTAFCRVNNNNSDSHRIGWYGGGDINAPASYFPFTAEAGYIGGEITNSPVGDFGGYSKSAGWDLSGLADAQNPTVKTIAGAEQVIYFKDLQASKYAVSVMLEHENAINDSFPKAGIIAGQNEKGMAVAMFDVSGSNTHDLFAVRRPAGGEWNWPGGSSDGISRYYGNLSYSNGVKLTVVRSGVDFYYFINGDFVFANQNTMFGTDDTVAGLITFGSADTFSDFEVITDTAQVDDIIASVKHSDATNKWQWTGDFEAVDEDAVTLKPGMANVGSDDYKIVKTGVTLSGSFELSFSVSKYSYSRIVPNWMTNYLTTRLFRENGSEDQFRLRLSTHADDTNSTANNPAKKIDAVFVGANHFSHTFDDVDFGSSAKKRIEIFRLVSDGTATFTVKVDGTQVLMFTSDYVGDYTFGFGNNYAAGEITDIYAGTIRGDAGGYEVTETHTAGGGTVTLDKTHAQMGEEVSVTLAPESGYKIGAFTVNDDDCYDDISNNVYTFHVMGDTQINVTFIAVTARTVTGKISVSDESVGSVSGASMKFVNAEGETPVTVNTDGSFSANLSDGKYRVEVTHTNTAFRKYESSITVSESNNTLNITLNGDPTVNGEMTGKDVYYTDARKLTVEMEGNHLDYYIYFGVDGFYMMFDVVAPRSELNAEMDNIEVIMQAGELSGLRAEGRSYHILMWSRLEEDGDYYAGYYDRINANHERDNDAANIKTHMTQAAKSSENGFRMEVMFDYAMFGLDGKPETFALTVGYKHNNAFKQVANTDYTIPLTYRMCNKDGFMEAPTAKAITVDGNLSDWDGVHKLSLVGTGNCDGKSVEFYGVLAEDGLYLAADAHHVLFVHGDGEWWRNTNFEFFVGPDNKQHYVYATAANTLGKSHDYMQIAYSLEGNATDGYHSVVEVFIPMANLEGMISNGVLRVGVAWKTIGDVINNGEGSGGNEDEYWVPKGTWTNNADKCYVSALGIYKK